MPKIKPERVRCPRCQKESKIKPIKNKNNHIYLCPACKHKFSMAC